MALQKFYHDPDAVLDYSVDWSNWLTPDDFLVDVEFFPDAGLKIVSSNVTNTVATVWLSGGAAGTTYAVVCHIITDSGRQDDRTFYLVAKDM